MTNSDLEVGDLILDYARSRSWTILILNIERGLDGKEYFVDGPFERNADVTFTMLKIVEGESSTIKAHARLNIPMGSYTQVIRKGCIIYTGLHVCS